MRAAPRMPCVSRSIASAKRGCDDSSGPNMSWHSSRISAPSRRSWATTSGRSSASWRAATHSSSSAREQRAVEARPEQLDGHVDAPRGVRLDDGSGRRVAMSVRSRAAIASNSAFTASTVSAAHRRPVVLQRTARHAGPLLHVDDARRRVATLDEALDGGIEELRPGGVAPLGLRPSDDGLARRCRHQRELCHSADALTSSTAGFMFEPCPNAARNTNAPCGSASSTPLTAPSNSSMPGTRCRPSSWLPPARPPSAPPASASRSTSRRLGRRTGAVRGRAVAGRGHQLTRRRPRHRRPRGRSRARRVRRAALGRSRDRTRRCRRQHRGRRPSNAQAACATSTSRHARLRGAHATRRRPAASRSSSMPAATSGSAPTCPPRPVSTRHDDAPAPIATPVPTGSSFPVCSTLRRCAT